MSQGKVALHDRSYHPTMATSWRFLRRQPPPSLRTSRCGACAARPSSSRMPVSRNGDQRPREPSDFLRGIGSPPETISAAGSSAKRRR